jgi:polysaccharide biosynthesis/export protein
VKKVIPFFIVLLLLSSCNMSKKIVYVQNAGSPVSYADTTKSKIPDPRLKVGDLLVITVNANTPEAALPFNLPLVPSLGLTNYDPSSTTISSAGGSLQNYLIDTNGEITFPIIGKIKAVGMTKTALSDFIKDKIHPFYIKEDPIISIRYANYKVSVLGEVARPSVYTIQNEKINIFEAIALAGDLTIYGKRDNVLLIRENDNGKRETLRIDLRDERLINSAYYYLQQNDVLYIQPNKPKSRASGLSTAETVSISVIGTLISLTSLIVTLLK